ncbi:MAG: DJ-1/PfpI family protein [Actinobacteria bacterium]|nr:DJ-1/PfpI family protein [Actinomycetota bacterium]
MSNENLSAMERSERGHEELASRPGVTMVGKERIAILLYPGFTALDVVGPHYFFASMMGATVHLVSVQENLDPVKSDLGLAIQPTIKLDDLKPGVDLFMIPGGSRTDEVLAKSDLMQKLAPHAAEARVVAGVCTGSLVLGQLGLLIDLEATTHWIAHDLLRDFGAKPVNQRFVDRGSVMTAAGVTAGMDLAIHYVAKQRGEDYAKVLELQGEYDPAPPFGCGTPDKAGRELSGIAADIFAMLVDRLKKSSQPRP